MGGGEVAQAGTQTAMTQPSDTTSSLGRARYGAVMVCHDVSSIDGVVRWQSTRSVTGNCPSPDGGCRSYEAHHAPEYEELPAVRMLGTAVPLSKARSLLVEALKEVGVASLHDGAVGYLRFEVCVTDVQDEEGALVWLRGQLHASPKVYFRVPERSLVVAGLGAADLVSGPGELGRPQQEALATAPTGFTYYGATRFDATYSKPSPEWEGFGGYYFVLPAVELVRRAEAGAHGKFVLACNLRFDSSSGLISARATALRILRGLHVDLGDHEAVEAPLPPPASCDEPAQFDAWHESIEKALTDMKSGRYRKVVLARAARFTFPCRPRPLDLVLRLRKHYGYLFCIQLDDNTAFLGCTPEQLFKVEGGEISTDALAGTRPRGTTKEDDERMAKELMASQKDMFENQVTAEYILEELRRLRATDITSSEAYVLKLAHVQHICKKIRGRVGPPPPEADAPPRSGSPAPFCPSGQPGGAVFRPAFELLSALHPTPAVCGQPRRVAAQAITQLEPFDRGLYAGPVGYVSSTCCEFAVAIRSVLVVGEKARVFAGAGIVPGSTAEGEWAEIGAKMKNFVRMFPPSPPPLRSLPNLATLWATLAVEELVRNGVTHFCVAPGSRSTPLVAAAARHPHATVRVHHDERGAAFYCVGYARAKGRPAAVIVTSGTAVANLLPAAVEAATDRVPLLLLTADRPPEQRDCGANQAVTQPGIFGVYARWSKDLPCPTDDILASAVLSDVDYAVSLARGADPGPVHLNFMFRENLAPEGGTVRDAAVPGLSSEWSDACLRDRRMAQWELSGPRRPYSAFPRLRPSCTIPPDLLRDVQEAKRGLIILGRLPTHQDRAYVSWLARELRWPVFVDIASGLRADALLRPYLIAGFETLLVDPALSAALDPDVVLQIGTPLISKRLPKYVSSCGARALVIVTPTHARRDPVLVVTHHLCSDISTFVKELERVLDWASMQPSGLLGVLSAVGGRLEGVICDKLGLSPEADRTLTEPMVAHLVARLSPPGSGIFLSNSMPVRDMDSFAYFSPASSGVVKPVDGVCGDYLSHVAINRGASGIDGILSSAMGYAVGLDRPVTLLIGDMALLHDLSSLHALAGSSVPLCVVLVNNGGGGIFSFLPIARHADIFTPYFDSPHDVAFGPVASAFSIPHTTCRTPAELVTALQSAHSSLAPTIIEVVTDRAENVRVHRRLASDLRATLNSAVLDLIRLDWIRTGPREKPSVLLLHGFLGCKEDWAPVLWSANASSSSASPSSSLHGLAHEWDCVAVDLPGHGSSTVSTAGADCSLCYSMPVVALALVRLLDRLGIGKCAVIGYSMGGRLAAYLAKEYPDRMLALVTVSSHPGLKTEAERVHRWEDDLRLSTRVQEASKGGPEKWEGFLRWWYSKPLWGRLAERTPAYSRMISRRRVSLEWSEDREGLSRAVLGMSLARQPDLWEVIRSTKLPTLMVYGASDVKYAALADDMRAALAADGGPGAKSTVEVRGIDDASHAVLAEKEVELLREVSAFLTRHMDDSNDKTTRSNSGAVATTPPAVLKPRLPDIRIGSLSCSTFVLTLKTPLSLSTGTLAERRGLHVVLQIDSGEAGVGEVSPLPGFSQDSFEEAEAQLQELAPLLKGRVVRLAAASSLLNEPLVPAWSAWLKHVEGQLTSPLLPSVRAGLEMAMAHAMAQVAESTLASVLGQGAATVEAGRVRINRLVTRGVGHTETGGGGVCKIKVGGQSVEQDVKRVKHALAESAVTPGHQQSSSRKIRLDANQAWTLEEAVAFVRSFSLTECRDIEYIEEPLRDPMEIPELYRRTGRALRFALDESLGQPASRDLSSLVGLEGLAAVVLKPTVLGGLQRCLEVYRSASAFGLATVVSSAFESTVGLCHLAVLASLVGPHDGLGGCAKEVSRRSWPVAHGLSTYGAFSEGVSFTSAISGGGGMVDVIICQELLDAESQQARRSNRNSNGCRQRTA